ncbi:MAG: DUF4278 domain-containing protein [Cyanobacteria bacterium P01_E01_bin.6]
MKLNYRGQSYHAPTQSVSGAETGVSGCFRGASYPLMQTVHENQGVLHIAYQFRGVTYLKSN